MMLQCAERIIPLRVKGDKWTLRISTALQARHAVTSWPSWQPDLTAEVNQEPRAREKANHVRQPSGSRLERARTLWRTMTLSSSLLHWLLRRAFTRLQQHAFYVARTRIPARYTSTLTSPRISSQTRMNWAIDADPTRSSVLAGET